jgi:hypothetical protein
MIPFMFSQVRAALRSAAAALSAAAGDARIQLYRQRASLLKHAEKKALVAALESGAPALDVGVNFKMCADCHGFYKAAPALLAKEICVREYNAHRFVDGACACHDKWRWHETTRPEGADLTS